MKVGLLILAVLLAGCTKSVGDDGGQGFPAGTKRITAPGNYITYVVPITLDDGTRCVVAVHNSRGGDVECNFQ